MRYYKDRYELETILRERDVKPLKIQAILQRANFGIPWCMAAAKIEGYHTRYCLKKHLEGKHSPLYGIELEVELALDDRIICNSDAAYIHSIAAATIGAGIIRTERDGSLRNGCEIIFAPLTEAEIRFKYSQIYKFLQALRKYGFKSHDTDTCGLHIHITKPPYNTIKKMEHLMLDKPDIKQFWMDLSRRTSYTFSRMQRQREHAGDKYFAINKLPDNTIEFRLFRGTLKPASFLAALESVFALVNHTDPDGDRSRHSWRSFTSMVRYGNKYKHFREYVHQEMRGDWKVKPYRKRTAHARMEAMSAVEAEKRAKREARELRQFNREQTIRQQYLETLRTMARCHGVSTARVTYAATAGVIPIVYSRPNTLDQRMRRVVTPILFAAGYVRTNDDRVVMHYTPSRGRRRTQMWTSTISAADLPQLYQGI